MMSQTGLDPVITTEKLIPCWQIDEAFVFDLMNLIGSQLVSQKGEESVRLNQSECYHVAGPNPAVYNQSREFIHSFKYVSN